MANIRLYGPNVRIGLASPFAFANWRTPTVAEMNASLAGAQRPYGAIWNLTCALDQDGTTFDLGDSETDDSLSFCQSSGVAVPTSYNPEIVFQAFRAKNPWTIAAPATLNTANLAFSLLAWRNVEYWAWLSVGNPEDALFAIGDRVKLARVVTDFGIDNIGSGENVTMTQTFGFKGDLNWNYKLAA